MKSVMKSVMKTIWVFLIVLVCGFGIWFYRHSEQNSEPVKPKAQSQVSPTPPLSGVFSQKPGNIPPLVHRNKAKPLDPEKQWKAFTDKFGSDLKPVFLKNGRLVSVKNSGSEGNPAGKEFSPESPEKAISRAREILEASRDLLGIQKDFPLENATFRGSSLSAHVFFNETYHGMTVQPVGTIKIDLGPEGELTALYSDYASQIQVTNQAHLSLQDAQERAKTVVSSSLSGTQTPQGGNQIIWVNGETEGRIAYQFIVRGHQVIIDAQDGSLLYKMDRRQF